MTDIALHPDDSRAKRNVAVLVAAQAILGAQMPMIFVVGGLAGQSLASNICFATLPISLIVLGSMLSATPISHLMQRYGRRTGFFIGAGAGALGGAIGAYGLYTASFPIFLLGSLITGTYMSAQGFYRFAAADTASDAFRAKAISYVMAGGLLSAVIGPQLVKATAPAPARMTRPMATIFSTPKRAIRWPVKNEGIYIASTCAVTTSAALPASKPQPTTASGVEVITRFISA